MKFDEVLQGKIESLKSKKPVTKARNLVQETAQEYEKYIVWKDYLNERRLLYSGAEICNKRFGFGVLKERLEWIKKKDCISPIGVFNYLKNP